MAFNIKSLLTKFFVVAYQVFLKSLEKSANQTLDGIVFVNENNQIIWRNQNAADWLGLENSYASNNIRKYFSDPQFANFLNNPDSTKSLEFNAPADKEKYLSLQIIPFGEKDKLIVIRDISKPMQLAKVRTDFTANASHELRSPLTVISGYIEIMNQENNIPEEWREPIQEISRQTERMQSVLTDLLMLFQLESERENLSDQMIDLNAMALSTKQDIMASKQSPKSFTLNISDPFILLGDEFKIQSVLDNILENAIRYSDEQGEINISWFVDKDGGHLAISDNGIGIEQKHIERLTERFYRIDKGRSRALGGTGLGLAIVKHALQNHGATLEIKSKFGHGSEFICHFPIERIKQ